MKYFSGVILCALALQGCCEPSKQYDVCIYGGTSAGVVAAYSAARLGKKVILVEPGTRFGGMTSGGLGFTDIGNKQAVSGLAKEFYRKIGAHYGHLEQWVFEPHVADSIFRAYLSEEGITLCTDHRITGVRKREGAIESMQVVQTQTGADTLGICADYFIDCSYEGDLMAVAGVTYTVGREANETYGETYNGVQLMTGHQFPDGVDPYVIPGDSTSGLVWGISPKALQATGAGDNLVQAYNYRICLTDREQNRIPITRPEGYDSTRYQLLLRLIEAQPEKRNLSNYFIWSRMPNGKTDINNRGGFSSDFIGMNHAYPEADYATRQQIIKAHTDYTKGLLYFVGHDKRVPASIREEMLRWGYPKDEYVESGNWSPQLYIRECRRMVGEYVATQADCQARVVPEDGIALAAYTMDSHNCQRIVMEKQGRRMVKNEGNVEIGGGLPYPISYRSITPKREECRNLLVPVCLSASHIAYGSIRMEPVFMVLGQAAAVAVCQAIDQELGSVQEVSAAEVRALMARDPYLDASTPDILVDDASEAVRITEAWQQLKRGGGFGPSYLELPASEGEQRASFAVEIAESGLYTLYSYEHANGHLTPTVDFEICAGDSVFHSSFDRTTLQVAGQTTGEWVCLGSYRFKKGEDSRIDIICRNTEAPTHADAVLLVKTKK